MSEHKRLYTLLQIIRLLKQPGGFETARLARRYDVSKRTVYRYFKLLKECRFELEKQSGRYRLKTEDPANNLLPLLSGEEASLLRDTVLAIPQYEEKSYKAMRGRYLHEEKTRMN